MNEIVVGRFYWLTHEATSVVGCQIVKVLQKCGGRTLTVRPVSAAGMVQGDEEEVSCNDIAEQFTEEVAYAR